MEDIEKITESLRKEAEEEKKNIISEAEEKAEEKKSEAREEAEEKAEEIIEEGKRKAEAETKKILSTARTKARRKKLEFKDKMSEEVFERAMKKLDELKDDNSKYRKIMKNLIIEGGISIEGGDLEVLIPEGDNILSEEDIQDIEEEINNSTGVESSIEVLENLEDSRGGAIVRKSDGTLQSDNTFEARMERMRDSLRTEIIEILFEED